MKKTFTLLLVLLMAALSVNAKTLWSGSQSYANYNTTPEADKRVMLTADMFADAAVGDKINVVFTYYAADPVSWHQVELWKTDMSQAITGGVHILDGDTLATFTLDEAMLTELKANGCNLAGTGYTVTEVRLDAKSNVLWSGSQTYADYQTIPVAGKPIVLPASMFAGAAEGDKLNISLTNYAADPQSWHQVELYAPDMSASLCPGVHVVETTTEAAFTLDATLLAKLQATGCAIAGTGFTVTKVTLEPNSGMIWQGNFAVGSWSSITIPKDNFAGVTKGSSLVFTFSDVPEGSGLVLKQNLPSGWATMPSGSDWISLTETEYVYPLTDADLETMQTYGLVLTGMSYTLTSVQAVVPSSIGQIAKATAVQGTIYNLNGQVVGQQGSTSHLGRGIYILNGKKFVIK